MFVSFGLISVLFLVAWHFALYIGFQFVEFLPAVLEWLDLRRLRRWIERITVWTTVLGAIVAIGRQSALGGPLPDRAWQAPSAVVLVHAAAVLLRLQHRGGHLDGDC